MNRLFLLLLVLLAGCQSLTGPPTAQADPKLIDAANVGICLIRAAGGDCTTPCASPVVAACPNLTSTATNADVANAPVNCIVSEAASQAMAVALAYKAVKCSSSSTPIVSAPFVVPPRPTATQDILMPVKP